MNGPTTRHEDAPALVEEPRGVLFLTLGAFSGTNAGVLEALRAEMPEIDFVELDVRQELGRSRKVLARCLLAVLREQGLKALRSREALRFHLLRSRSFSRALRGVVARHVADRPYRATLQTQSLYNAAMPGIPNFVYTDHVALARLRAGVEQALTPGDAWLACERTIYTDAAHVFTFGPRIREILIEAYAIDAEKVSVAGGGSNIATRGPIDNTLARYARRNILFVGVDWERKGGPELVAAFDLVRERFPDSTLTIVGCTPPLPPRAGVTILGRLPFEAVVEHYEAASLFCMPSRLEPFGIAIAEAMQFALPVVSTSVGDIASMVIDGESGRLVPPGDVPALARALTEMLASAERMQTAGACSAANARNFTWRAVARRIAAQIRRTA